MRANSATCPDGIGVASPTLALEKVTCQTQPVQGDAIQAATRVFCLVRPRGSKAGLAPAMDAGACPPLRASPQSPPTPFESAEANGDWLRPWMPVPVPLCEPPRNCPPTASRTLPQFPQQPLELLAFRRIDQVIGIEPESMIASAAPAPHYAPQRSHQPKRNQIPAPQATERFQSFDPCSRYPEQQSHQTPRAPIPNTAANSPAPRHGVKLNVPRGSQQVWLIEHE